MRRTIGYLLATIVVCTILANTVSAGELEDQLINSARSGRVDEVKSLLDKGANINARDAKGQTALIWGIQNIDIVRLLIEKGANVNAYDKDGRTALMQAVFSYSGSLNIVRLLIEKGADMNVRDEYGGNTALMYAVSSPKADVVRLLIEKGANLNVTDKLGLNTALSLAQFFEKGKSFGQQKQKEIEDIVRMLERAGAKLPVGYVR
jgi:ankyrin repeat protein